MAVCSPRSGVMNTFFSLGYQLRDLSGFVGKLQEAEIDLVVDVRETAWSHKPGFAKGPLSRALGAAGIEYLHASFAGNPKRIRRLAEDHRECLDRFEQHLDEHFVVIHELDELIAGITGAGLRACFVCFERHPADCHRSILLRQWSRYTSQSYELIDLDPDGAPRFLKPERDPPASCVA